MKKIIAVIGLLATVASFANCEFTSHNGAVYPSSVQLKEVPSQDGRYTVIKAETHVEGYPFHRVVMVKNVDGTYPSRGIISFNENAHTEYPENVVLLKFVQKIKQGKIIFEKSFEDSSFKDTLVSTVKLDDEGEIVAFKINEILREYMEILPIIRTVGTNKLSCSLL